MPQGSLIMVSKFNEEKEIVEGMDNVSQYGYVYIYYALLLNGIE